MRDESPNKAFLAPDIDVRKCVYIYIIHVYWEGVCGACVLAVSVPADNLALCGGYVGPIQCSYRPRLAK